MVVPPFADRRIAGRILARELRAYADRPDVLVLGLPRGGVPVAAEVAAALRAPLDIVLVRKLGVPGHEELAMGALAEDGSLHLDDALIEQLGISSAAVVRVLEQEREVLGRYRERYRAGRPPPEVRGRCVILVDDGVATGATMRAALRALRSQAPRAVIVAAPVASRSACRLLSAEADACVVTAIPEPFLAVGAWYRDFPPTTDAEVRAALARQPVGSAVP